METKGKSNNNTTADKQQGERRGRAVWLFLFTIVALAVPNVALCFTEHMALLPALSNVTLPVAAVWLLMTCCRRPGLMAWLLFPLIFLAAFQTVLLYLFGSAIISVDMFLNVVTTNPTEAIELLDNLAPALVIVAIVYLPILIIATVSLRRKDLLSSRFLLRQRRYALVGTAAGLVCMGATYAADDDYELTADLYPANVIYNIKLAVERDKASREYEANTANFKFGSTASHNTDEREIYVLVIGETARAINFGLYGYDRNTTPLLQKTDGVIVFADVLTQSNVTHKSVPMLLSAASATDYERLYREKGIIAAYREAGFHTVFISNQKPNHSFIDKLGMEADEWMFIKEKADKNADTTDENMLKVVEKVLAEGRRREFIVLHTYGSHFNYRDRYGDKDSYFKPDGRTEAKASNRPSLINAYDNTIRCTDRFLHNLTTMLDREGAISAWLYVSDHGENIFDDERGLFLHSSPNPTEYELRVPMIMRLSAGYRKTYARTDSILRANSRKKASSNAVVFHTMLETGGITTAFRNDSLSLASSRYTPGKRYYINDRNEGEEVLLP